MAGPAAEFGQFSWLCGIATDDVGNVNVPDTNNFGAQKIDSTGNVFTKWGSQGTGEESIFLSG